MPLYEYICTECGHEFDRIQSFSAEPVRVCEKCDKESVKKKISNAGFILKGGGWYKDHYGLKSSSPEPKSSSSESSSTSSNDKD